MDNWLTSINDNPNLSEADLVKKLWNNQPQKPTTKNPEVKFVDDKVVITCKTDGASIGYKTNQKTKSWKIYSCSL